jgi:Na+-transporting methylmalonyl-CoA/oxaloacetate decarboxylase gamma subunit
MTEAIINLINRSKPDEFIALVLIFGGSMLVAIIAIVGSFIYHFRKREAEINLKHEMIARGMSADEIERVLAAKSASVEKR